MVKLKFKDAEGTVSSVITDAMSEIQSLAEECREIVDNASEGLQQTQRIQTLDETASSLESVNEPDVDDALSDVKVKFQAWANSRKGRGLSRADRCSYTCSLLEAAAGALEDFASNDDPETDEDAVAAADTLRDELESIKGDIDNLEFPGMYG